MGLPTHRTRIVATIGPASDSAPMLERLIRAGMNVARLNFSHGAFDEHAARIARIRQAEAATGKPVTIMADLPGPKMRIGEIRPEPVQLATGARFVLTADDVVGDEHRASTTLKGLASAVKPGDRLSVNDGLIQLVVEAVDGADVVCRVEAGGELRSRKGLNLPGIDLGLRAFTEHDRDCLAFALSHGVEAVSMSFVRDAEDVVEVREAAAAMGHRPFVLAKIERVEALGAIDAILEAADGVMVARGDLGVEVPIEEIGVLQKRLIASAVAAGKPVITATQMLESMTSSRLPTRAEVTDVTNAILDGTDAVMLSAESAMGRWPEESVRMLARIAAGAEAHREEARRGAGRAGAAEPPATTAGAIADVVEHALRSVPCAAVFVPTRTGTTARRISSLKPPVWVVCVSTDESVCRSLAFSQGVHAVHVDEDPEDWSAFAREWMRANCVRGSLAMLVAGPSPKHPDANHRLEFLRVER